MSKFLDIIKQRRSYYDISSNASVSDEAIEEIITQALLHVPSAYNAHMAKAVLLLNKNHKRLWDIVEESLRKIVPEDKFAPTKKKIDGFSAGYGTVLFFNDTDIMRELQQKAPLYKEAFPLYAQHGTGMVQFAVWSMLKEAGMGASLQHYGNLIEKQVQEEWNLPKGYSLIAQMPFGVPNSEPEEKVFPPVEDLFKKFV